MVGLRSVVFFGLQAFVPVYFAHRLGTSEAAGNAALSVMLVAGAGGTYVGGRLMDRVGRRVILVGSMALLCPLLVLFLLVGRWPATALLVGIGFVVISNFSVTVVMGQEYMPSRLGLASGIMLGAAIGFGGVAAAALGALADATSLDTTMWVIALTPLPALLLALSLPPTSTDRRLRARETRKPRWCGALRAGHGSPLTTSSQDFCVLPGRRDTPGRLDRPPALVGRRVATAGAPCGLPGRVGDPPWGKD